VPYQQEIAPEIACADPPELATPSVIKDIPASKLQMNAFTPKDSAEIENMYISEINKIDE
jgi:hypothetical protein